MPSDCGCNKAIEFCCGTEPNCECRELAEEIQCKAREIIELAERLKCTCDRPVEVKLECEVKRPDCCSHRPDCKCNKCCK